MKKSLIFNIFLLFFDNSVETQVEFTCDYSFKLSNIPLNEFSLKEVNVDHLKVNNDNGSPAKLLAYNSNVDIKNISSNYLVENSYFCNLAENEAIPIFNLENFKDNNAKYGFFTELIIGFLYILAYDVVCLEIN